MNGQFYFADDDSQPQSITLLGAEYFTDINDIKICKEDMLRLQKHIKSGKPLVILNGSSTPKFAPTSLRPRTPSQQILKILQALILSHPDLGQAALQKPYACLEEINKMLSRKGLVPLDFNSKTLGDALNKISN
jgi:hypothetical protein